VITYTKKELYQALINLGIKKNDILFCSSSLFELGAIENVNTKEELCEVIYNVCFDVIGVEGTLVVPSYTPLLGKFGGDFILEETPTTTGIFSEYIRKKDISIRSLHPINSVSAIGPCAQEICLNVPSNCYAIDSPFFRLYELGAKAVTLGAYRSFGAWIHLCEALCGLPYIYNKLLDVEVYAKGNKVEQEFYTSVRYLYFDIHYNLQNVEQLMVDKGITNFTKVGGGRVSVISGKEYFIAVKELLNIDPYAFLRNKPEFKFGSIPFDGKTGQYIE